jgi:biopolymer transport protein ExbD
MLRSLDEILGSPLLILLTAFVSPGCKCSCSVEAGDDPSALSASASASSPPGSTPPSATAEATSPDRVVVVVRDDAFIAKRDKVEVGRAKSLPELGKILAAQPSDSKASLTIAASPETPYATIVKLMDVARDSGFAEAHFKVRDE